MEGRRAILAVRPHLAQALVAGRKRVEFRRARPALGAGDIIYVYATSPVQAVVGSFICGNVVEASPTTLWREYSRASEITRAAFRDYFNGSRKGYAIEVTDPTEWIPPLALHRLREVMSGFHPPRSYRFVPDTVDLRMAR